MWAVGFCYSISWGLVNDVCLVLCHGDKCMVVVIHVEGDTLICCSHG